MTLSVRLALALALAAIVPMAIVVGLPLVLADRRAAQETARRLDLARRQGALWIERRSADAAGRVVKAAIDLARDRTLRDPFVEGPEGAARDAARALADRQGLDVVEVLGADGAPLGSGPEAIPSPAEVPLAANGEAALREIARGPAGALAPAFVSRHVVPGSAEPLTVVGARFLDRAFLEDLAEISGHSVSLVGASGAIAASAGARPPGVATAETEVPLGDSGFRLRLEVQAGNVSTIRKELVGSFAGVAPLALAVALGVGLLLARGIAGPIRELARRAEAIAAERGGFAVLDDGMDEVRRLEDAFDRMLDSLAESERRRIGAERIAAWQDVARRIAHEVKNPLSPIKMAVENLRRTREKAPEDLDRALGEESATILEEVESLRRLVDEFSQFARLPSPTKVRTDLRQIAAQALALFEARVDSLGVRVGFPEGGPEWVDADPEQIGRLLKNVLSNALDALEPVEDRRLDLSIARYEGEPAFLEVEVRDSGVGLTAEAARRVFEPYFTTRAERGGTGLGMAIAQRIATEHDGSLEIHGAPGRGATVTLRLPAGPRDALHS